MTRGITAIEIQPSIKVTVPHDKDIKCQTNSYPERQRTIWTKTILIESLILLKARRRVAAIMTAKLRVQLFKVKMAWTVPSR